MLSSDTKRRIDSARDILVGKLPLPTDQVELITLALIYKFMDDLDEQSVQLGGKRSFFVKDLEPYRWRSLLSQKISGADRVKTFADGLEALGDAKTAKHLPEMFRDVFRDSMLKFRDGQTLSLFLQEIDGFTYSHSEELGNAFEYLLQTMGIQGDNGQFRTPRHIIDFIVEILEPKPEEKILDPACGTGGFLVSAYKHILAKHTSKGSSVPGDQLSPAKREKLTQNLSGYDITPMMVKLSKVNLFLHGFSDPQIHEYDTLSNDARWNEKADVIMANPPFMTPKGGVVPHTKFRVAAKKAEVLFSDYIAEHLTTNGRAGVIVPEGIIFQSATAYKALRKFLVEDCLVAVISLPAGVFNPYSGVKTSILILDKGLARQTDSIAFFKVENDGYDLGAQRRQIEKNDLPGLTKEIHGYLEKLRSGKKGSEKESSHLVSKAKIAKNGDSILSGERYREAIQQKAEYDLKSLGDLLEIQSGFPFKSEFFNEDSGTPVIRIRDIKPNRTETRFNGKYDKEFIVKNGDLLVGMDGEFNSVIWSGGEALLNQRVCRLHSFKGCIKEYVAALIQRKLKQIESETYAVTVKHLSTKQIASIQIPLAPLETQKEIVAEIEGYQKVIDGARSVVENYKPQIPIDPKWPVESFETVTETITPPLKIQTSDFKDTGLYPIIDQGQNTIAGRTDDTDALIDAKGGLVIFGDHTCAVKYIEEPFAQGADGIKIIKPSERLKPKFVFFFLLSHSIQPDGYKRHFSKLKESVIAIPPLETQEIIISDIEKEQAMVDANKELIARFEKKIQGVMDRVWGNGTGN